MKQVAAAVVIAALLGLSPLLTPHLAAAADWGLIDENDDSSFYYDKSTAQRHDAGKVRVTTRAVYTREGKADALQVLKHYKNMENLTESQYTYDMDCVEQRSHLLDVKHLNKKGEILKSTELGGVTQWEEVVPDSRLAYVLEEVCPR
jgi:hypothetical protein